MSALGLEDNPIDIPKALSGCCGKNALVASKSQGGTPEEVVVVVLVRADVGWMRVQGRRVDNQGICKRGQTGLGDGLKRRSERDEVLRITARFLVKATGSAEFLFMETGETRGGAGLGLKIRTSPAVSAPWPGSLQLLWPVYMPLLGFPFLQACPQS